MNGEKQHIDPDKNRKLYNKLFEDQLYTKGYDDFREQFGDPDRRKRLHERLEQDRLVTIDYDTFSERYFSGAGGPSTSGREDADPALRVTEDGGGGTGDPPRIPPGTDFHDLASSDFRPSPQPSPGGEGEGDPEKDRNPFSNFARTFWNVSSKQLPAAIEGGMAALPAEAPTRMDDPDVKFQPTGDRLSRNIMQRRIRNLPEDERAEFEAERESRNLERRKKALTNALEGFQDFQTSQEGLVTTTDQIEDSIDVINYVANSVAQAAAQIPAALLSGGFTSVGQEVGIIYMDQVEKIAEQEGITPEEVIEQGLDDRASAIAYGTFAGALDYLGAKVASKAIPYDRFKNDVANRALRLFGAMATEGATEGGQSVTEQFGGSRGAGRSLFTSITDVNLREVGEEALAGSVGGGGVNVAAQVGGAVRERVTDRGRRTEDQGLGTEETTLPGPPSADSGRSADVEGVGGEPRQLATEVGFAWDDSAAPAEQIEQLNREERRLFEERQRAEAAGQDVVDYDAVLDRVGEIREGITAETQGAQRGEVGPSTSSREGTDPALRVTEESEVRSQEGAEVVRDLSVKPVEVLEQELADMKQRQAEGSNDPGLAGQIATWEEAIENKRQGEPAQEITDADVEQRNTLPAVVEEESSPGPDSSREEQSPGIETTLEGRDSGRPVEAGEQFGEFRDIVLESDSPAAAFERARGITDVNPEVAEAFRQAYDPEGQVTPERAFERFYHEVKVPELIPERVSERNPDVVVKPNGSFNLNFSDGTSISVNRYGSDGSYDLFVGRPGKDAGGVEGFRQLSGTIVAENDAELTGKLDEVFGEFVEDGPSTSGRESTDPALRVTEDGGQGSEGATLPAPKSRGDSGRALEQGSLFGRRVASEASGRAMDAGEPQGARSRREFIDERWVSDPQSLTDVINSLVDTVGLTLRQGRIRLRNAVGQYDEKTGVARTRMIKSLRTIAHEAGHDIMRKFGSELRPVANLSRQEVEGLAYEGTPAGQEIDEGFAEFMRLFIENPVYLEKNTPKFLNDFMTWLDGHPDLKEGLEGVQGAYQTWLMQPSDVAAVSEIHNTPTKTAKLLADIKDKGVFGTLTDLKNKAYTAVVDELHPVRMGVTRLLEIHKENTGESIDLKTAEDSYRLARLTADAYAGGQMDIEFGVENYETAQAEGPALRDALETAFDGEWTSKNITSFGSYLASRRLVHEWGRYENGDLPNPPSKLSKEAHELNVQRLETSNPTYSAAADQVYEWNNNLWAKKRDAGIITDEQYADGIDNHPDYVPLYRNMEDRDPTTGGTGTGSTGKSGVIRAFRGSDRDIINPVESLMQDAYETAVFIKKNDAKRALINLARRVGAPAGEVVEEIPNTAATAVHVDPADVLKKLKDQTDWSMMSDRDALTFSKAAESIDNMDLPMVSIWKQGEINERGEPIIYAWEDGKRIALRLADGDLGVDMYNAFVNLGKESTDMIVNALAYPASWLRMGITTDPSFVFANLARDQVAAWILTEDFTPVISTAKGLMSEVQQDEYSRLYRSMSGLSTQNVSAINKNRVQQEIKDLRKKNIVVRRMTSVRGFSELTDLSEISTRIGVFRSTHKKAQERGLTDKEAALEAAYQSRDLIDFGRHGSKMIATRRLVTFMNAAIQGLDKGVRVLSAEGNLKESITPFIKDVNGRKLTGREQEQLNLAKKAWAKTAVIGVMGAALVALWMDDEDFDEIDKTYMRSTHWMIPVPGTDENGVRNWVAIPKPFELAFISNTFEHALEGFYHKDPEAFSRWLGSMYEIMAPPTRAPGLAVPIEVWANKRFFDDRPIVQERQQGLEPWMQYNSYTSDFGKWMGRQLNVSPAVVDHVITGFTGTWGRSLLSMTSDVAPNDPEAGWDDTWVARRFIRSIDRGAFSEQNFWNEMARNEGELMSTYQTFRDLDDTGVAGEASEYFEKLEDWQQMYVAHNYLRVNDSLGRWEKHPMDMARNTVSALSKIRRDLRETEDFDSSEKRRLDDLVDRLATAEFRNALIAAHHPSYETREMMDVENILNKVRNVSPDFYEGWLQRRYAENSLMLDPTEIYLQFSRDFDGVLEQYSVGALSISEGKRGASTSSRN